jgi:hypothetical protein
VLAPGCGDLPRSGRAGVAGAPLSCVAKAVLSLLRLAGARTGPIGLAACPLGGALRALLGASLGERLPPSSAAAKGFSPCPLLAVPRGDLSLQAGFPSHFEPSPLCLPRNDEG